MSSWIHGLFWRYFVYCGKLLRVDSTLIETGWTWQGRIDRCASWTCETREFVLEFRVTFDHWVKCGSWSSWTWLIAAWPTSFRTLGLSLLSRAFIMRIFLRFNRFNRFTSKTQAYFNMFCFVSACLVCVSWILLNCWCHTWYTWILGSFWIILFCFWLRCIC